MSIVVEGPPIQVAIDVLDALIRRESEQARTVAVFAAREGIYIDRIMPGHGQRLTALAAARAEVMKAALDWHEREGTR